MSLRCQTFKERYDDGYLDPEDIYEFIQAWHQPLHEFLGLTLEEYKKFIRTRKLPWENHEL